MPQVRFIALRYFRRLYPICEYDDLYQDGMVGLVSAVDGFDENSPVKFKTFAEHRIRGAILDKIRSIYPLSRQERDRLGATAEAKHRATQKLQRTPDEAEVARELGISLPQYQRERGLFPEVSLHSLSFSSSGSSEFASLLADPRYDTARLAELGEQRDIVARCSRQLSPSHKLVLGLVLAGASYEQIAAATGVSGISRLKATVITRLRRLANG